MPCQTGRDSNYALLRSLRRHSDGVRGRGRSLCFSLCLRAQPSRPHFRRARLGGVTADEGRGRALALSGSSVCVGPSDVPEHSSQQAVTPRGSTSKASRRPAPHVCAGRECSGSVPELGHARSDRADGSRSLAFRDMPRPAARGTALHSGCGCRMWAYALAA